MIIKFQDLYDAGFETRVMENPHALEIRWRSDLKRATRRPEQATALADFQFHFELDEQEMLEIEDILWRKTVLKALRKAMVHDIMVED